MSIEEIKDMLTSTGLPVAYRSFPHGKAPKLPFVVFYEEGDNNFAADGIVYSSTVEVAIELYTDEKEPETEKLIEDALQGVSLFWTKDESYIAEERFLQIRYEIEV